MCTCSSNKKQGVSRLRIKESRNRTAFLGIYLPPNSGSKRVGGIACTRRTVSFSDNNFQTIQYSRSNSPLINLLNAPDLVPHITADIKQQAVSRVMMPSVEAASMAAFTPFHITSSEVNNNNNNHQGGSNLAYFNDMLNAPTITDSAYSLTCTSAASSASDSLQAEPATSNYSELLSSAATRPPMQKSISKTTRKSRGKSVPLTPPFKPCLGDKRGGKAAFVSSLFE
jgi:hypothetical protein